MFSTSTTPRCQEYHYLFGENGIDFTESMETNDDGIVELAKGAAVVMTCARPFPAALIERLDQTVKCIIKIAIGYDSVDVDAATQRGIMVCNVPDYGLQEVAVHTIALMLAAVRKVCLYSDRIRDGAWKHVGYLTGYPSRRLSTLILGLMGFGGIARLVGKYASGFDMKVIAYDPFVSDDVFAAHGVEKVEQDELFARADVISLHMPLFDSTAHIINKERIAKMKDGVILINTARGGLIRETDLLEALKTGKVRAAGLDVFESEPVSDPDYPLFHMDNVVVTPHIAYQTEESYQDLQRKAVEIAIAAAKGGVPYSTVNKKALGLA